MSNALVGEHGKPEYLWAVLGTVLSREQFLSSWMNKVTNYPEGSSTTEGAIEILIYFVNLEKGTHGHSMQTHMPLHHLWLHTCPVKVSAVLECGCSINGNQVIMCAFTETQCNIKHKLHFYFKISLLVQCHFEGWKLGSTCEMCITLCMGPKQCILD